MSDAASEPERADPVVPGRPSKGMVDAEEFLGFTQRLRALHTKVDAADVSERGQWQRQLLAVTETAQTDLDRAKDRLERLERELDNA